MRSKSGKRKCEDVEVTERRITRGITSGKSPLLTNQKISISSASTEIDDHDKSTERPIGPDGNYYECEMCYKVGRLLCCESCPRAYHLKCLGLEAVPEGHWECPSCCDDFSKPLKYLMRDFDASKENDEPAAPKLKYSSASSKRD
ncbi:hypothetical protein QN277_010202 [Acacia crassicarpa]|uniref:PHD-type domain-containing protein n=1 Tax=Acacia crassicarpa TaxID=499986 RepID=A0AAE1IQI4_9FABA|nr:hypothetical protein QN277_010202 [Acacia crassicarpa]